MKAAVKDTMRHKRNREHGYSHTTDDDSLEERSQFLKETRLRKRSTERIQNYSDSLIQQSDSLV